jgi:hypothetical protein
MALDGFPSFSLDSRMFVRHKPDHRGTASVEALDFGFAGIKGQDEKRLQQVK